MSRLIRSLFRLRFVRETPELVWMRPAAQALVSGLSSARETRASVLLKIVEDPRFIEKEQHLHSRTEFGRAILKSHTAKEPIEF